MIKADLHTHSHYSDGDISPTELVRRAKKAGISVLALTDHNSVKGIDEALRAGKKYGVRVIPGVEVTYKISEVLGYFVDYKSKSIVKELAGCSSYADKKARLRLMAMKKKGMPVSLEEFEKSFCKSRGNHNSVHLREYLMEKGMDRDYAIRLINSIKIRKPKKKNINLIEAIRLIKRNGGVPVLAHPWFDTRALTDTAMKRCVAAGLKGIELDNGDRRSWGRTSGIERKIRRCARKYGLIMTKGSDYHAREDFMVPGHRMGATYCSEKTVKELELLKQNL